MYHFIYFFCSYVKLYIFMYFMSIINNLKFL